MGVLQQRWVLIPSGIHPGTEISSALRGALAMHIGVPVYQPVIEEGTYADFKACVFRACSVRICEVALEDMEQECIQKGVYCLRCQHRRWNYTMDRACVTSVEIRMEIRRGSRLCGELEEFLSYLARKYEFVYNTVVVNHQREFVRERDYGGYGYGEVNVTVEMEIVWQHWT
jgi:hypothetical protein